MIATIRNKIGVKVEIPHYDADAYKYCDFYMNFAGQIICQNIAKTKVVVTPPYTVHKYHLGTGFVTSKEVT